MAIEFQTSPSFIPRIVAEYVRFAGQTCKIRQTIVFETPFFTLLHFEVEPRRVVPRVLVVEPLSGIRARLLFDMLTDIAANCDAYALIWTDPVNIRAEEGPFGMEDNIDAVAQATRLLGPGVHLIGLCQSALPALAATAILCANEDSARPASLTLLGGKLDTRINPAHVDRLTRRYTLDWFERNVITRVPAFHVGAGRPVYSANYQAMTLHFLLMRHMLTGGEIFRKILHDDSNETSTHPFLSILMSPVAIPGEFFLDTVAEVFHDSALAKGRLRWRGLVVDPRAIMDVALLTIEAEEDDIAAPGQTYIAHRLCRTIPNSMRGHHSQPSIGHFGLFHGVVWRRIILPLLCKFLMEHQRITVA